MHSEGGGDKALDELAVPAPVRLGLQPGPQAFHLVVQVDPLPNQRAQGQGEDHAQGVLHPCTGQGTALGPQQAGQRPRRADEHHGQTHGAHQGPLPPLRQAALQQQPQPAPGQNGQHIGQRPQSHHKTQLLFKSLPL